MNVAALPQSPSPLGAYASSPAPPPPPASDRYEGPTFLGTMKNIVGVTAFAAGPAMAAAQWGLPGALLGVGASMLAMYAMDRDREIMVPFTGLCSGILSLPGLFFGWPGAAVCTAVAAGYGFMTR